MLITKKDLNKLITSKFTPEIIFNPQANIIKSSDGYLTVYLKLKPELNPSGLEPFGVDIGLLKAIPDNILNLSFDGKIVTINDTYKIFGNKKTDLIILPEINQEFIELEVNDLLKLQKFTSKQPAKNLDCILVDTDSLIATDSFRMVKIHSRNLLSIKMLIPKNTVKFLGKFKNQTIRIAKTDSQNLIKIVDGNKEFLITYPGVEFDYPDYRTILNNFENQKDIIICLNHSEINPLLKNIIALYKYESCIEFIYNVKTTEFICETFKIPTYGEPEVIKNSYQLTISRVINFEPKKENLTDLENLLEFKLCFNAGFLNDCLNFFNSEEQILLKTDGDFRPVLINNDIVLMPRRNA